VTIPAALRLARGFYLSMRDAFARYQEHFWLSFDLRVRGLARRLWEAGFSPIALDDDDDDDEPLICLACTPEHLVAEAHRLHELVRSWCLPEHAHACSGDGDTCGMEAVYDPARRDACLTLWGIQDSMLLLDLGVRPAAARPLSNTTRSGGAGIAR